MPFSYMIDRGRTLAVAGLTGRVDASVFSDAMYDLYSDDEWSEGMKSLWDLRYVDELVISPDDIPAMVNVVGSLREKLGDGRAAFVAPHEPVHSIARLILLRTRVPERERRVFRQINDALDWLDVSLPDDYTPGARAHNG
ncbi:hypothetical protein [Longibacter sp.]|uniref:hypothetical protein n=1 Tax=Longibacter sp. TaxID=2045415 RepID=UPI003EBE4160